MHICEESLFISDNFSVIYFVKILYLVQVNVVSLFILGKCSLIYRGRVLYLQYVVQIEREWDMFDKCVVIF